MKILENQYTNGAQGKHFSVESNNYEKPFNV